MESQWDYDVEVHPYFKVEDGMIDENLTKDFVYHYVCSSFKEDP